MARQILSPIDLRTTAEREGITRTQQTAQAIAEILKTVGKAEQVRRDRQTLDRVTRAISEGATTIEAITAAAREKPEFGGGLRGGLQRFAGLFQPSPGGIQQGLQQSIIGQRLQQALSPPIPEGLEPSGISVSPTGGVTKRFARPQKSLINIFPFEPTEPEKALDKDVKILSDVHKTGPQKGKLIANPIQQKSARKRLRANPALQDITPGQFNYSITLKGKPRVKVGTFDEAFGKEAYIQALQEAKDLGLSQGATEASVEVDFNQWWDKQIEKESGDTFIEFIPRDKFGIKPTTTDRSVGGLVSGAAKRLGPIAESAGLEVSDIVGDVKRSIFGTPETKAPVTQPVSPDITSDEKLELLMTYSDTVVKNKTKARLDKGEKAEDIFKELTTGEERPRGINLLEFKRDFPQLFQNEMSDDFLAKISKLDEDKKQQALQAINNGFTEEEVLASIGK